MTKFDDFEPSDYSGTHKKENRSFLLLQNLTKSNEAVVWRLEGGLRQDTDGFVEIAKNNKFEGKLEVQVRPIDSTRKATPCYSVERELVGHGLRAGLPFILICYDEDNATAYWTLINHEIFEGKASQKSVTVHFDTTRDRIADGSPYFDRWLELVAQHREAVHEYRELWESLFRDIALKDLSEGVIDGYQRYIDTVNNGFDGEFQAIKTILHPGVWKFGICVYKTNGRASFHRLYRIPKGRNGLLVMRGTPEEVSGWFERVKKAKESPLGFQSKLFDVRALHDTSATNFLDRPERQGREFLFKAFSEVVEMESLPLHGELLCRENIFAFTDVFWPVLGFSEAQDRLDPVDTLQRIERFVDWCMDVILTVGAGIIVLDNNSLREYSRTGLSEGFVLKPRAADETLRMKLREAIYNTNYLLLARSSCRSLANLGHQQIERVFIPNGNAPLALSKEPNVEILKENLLRILYNRISEYRKFVEGNGFSKLKSPVYLNDDVALHYQIELGSWLRSLKDSGMGFALTGQIERNVYLIPNEHRELPKVSVEFVDSLPDAHSDVKLVLNGKEYNLRGSSGLIEKAYTDHPLREQIYQMLKKDAKSSYDPNTMSDFELIFG